MRHMAAPREMPDGRRYRRLGMPEGSELVLGMHVRLANEHGRLVLSQRPGGGAVLVNGSVAEAAQPRWLEPGDVVRMGDAVIVAGRSLVGLNEVAAARARGSARLRPLAPADAPAPGSQAPRTGALPRFYPAPRLAEAPQPLTLAVDAPPPPAESRERSVLAQLGPSLAMAVTSLAMAAGSLARLADGSGVLAVAPSASAAVAMVCASIVWPLVSARVTRRREEREEGHRCQRYVSYLDGVENRLARAAADQARVLRESLPATDELRERARTLSPLLMNRMAAHDDFMAVRAGVGTRPLLADVSWPASHFSLHDDRMMERVCQLAQNPPRLEDVPVVLDLARHHVVGVLAPRDEAWAFVRGILLQVGALFSYEEVKIVLIADAASRDEWAHLVSTGHLYGGDAQTRLVALTARGLAACDRILCGEFDLRESGDAAGRGACGPHYLIVCANAALAQRSAAVGRVLAQDGSLGATALYLGHDRADLPRECGYLVDLAPGEGGCLRLAPAAADAGRRACLFERSDVAGSLRWFDPDIMVSREEARAFALSLSRVRLGTAEHAAPLPDSLGFLALLGVGNVGQLDVAARWDASDASRTLRAPIGVDAHGDVLALDLHEAAQGPHGLIAGTTGSGKSELIITYVLAACLTYAPDEIAFVLIDYKGGGLAGAFDNARHRLPHLAGTVTNLDGAAIRRSLVAIEGELRRRQALFNRARAQTGEATMDIDRYLSYYRRGVLVQPCPHLVIVADEFAELKAQEPAFMDELMSAARIGRSLGVHLVLATQKPSGVVNDQIWSNARFKLCLKVADAADSREMLRTPDAADITHVGRFYLLVGYREQYVCGQAAYAGGSYVARDGCERPRDLCAELLGDEGETLARLRPASEEARGEGSELDAVLAALAEAAAARGLRARQLWLPPLDATVTLHDLARRYGPPPSGGLTCVVGELDDPANQRRLRLDADLGEVGNVMLVGTPASGADDVALAMLVSLAQQRGSDALWLYALDGGAGTLRALEALPHCGGVVSAADDEGRAHLLQMLSHDAKTRRQAHLGQPDGAGEAPARLPRVVTCVSNLDALLELSPEAEEALVTLAREGPRYGMHLVMTASPVAIRPRLRAGFGMELALMLDDASAYAAVLGTLPAALPARAARRGLAQAAGDVLELVGATVAADAHQAHEVIAAVAARGTAPVARPIPRLPARVLPAHMGACGATSLPVGYAKREVAPVALGLAGATVALVLGNDAHALAAYLRGVYELCAQTAGATWVFVDPHHALGVTDDRRVRSGAGQVGAFVGELVAGAVTAEVVVFVNVVQTIASLPEEAAARLQAYLAQDGTSTGPALVVATEAWRTGTLYHDWWRVASARNSGVWVGGGFSEQTTFRFARMEGAYRAPAGETDGFLVNRGAVTAVRLLGATGGAPAHDTNTCT